MVFKNRGSGSVAKFTSKLIPIYCDNSCDLRRSFTKHLRKEREACPALPQFLIFYEALGSYYKFLRSFTKFLRSFSTKRYEALRSFTKLYGALRSFYETLRSSTKRNEALQSVTKL